MGQKVYCLRLLVKSDSYFTSHVYCCVWECEINKQPSLIIHDVILTDQSGVVLEITTQHETEKKTDFKKFSLEEEHARRIYSLTSLIQSLDKVQYVLLKE